MIRFRPGILDRLYRIHGYTSWDGFARGAGVPADQMSTLRHGKIAPSIETVALLCEAFGYTPGELLEIAPDDSKEQSA